MTTSTRTTTGKREAKRPPMTAEEATSFDRPSLMHAAILLAEAEKHGCKCQPYADWFTYNRWQAQGMQVQRGEHGVRLSVFVSKTTEDGHGKVKTVTFPKGTTVFCRCQVKAKAEAA